jgi:hypothetical protein
MLGNATVGEWFEISEEEIDNKIEECEGDDSEYWERCKTFFLDLEEKPVASINDKQFNWLKKIEDDLAA